MNISSMLKNEFSLQDWQVENVVKLIDEDNTIPFIARYRKELTGSMDDQALRLFSERLTYLRNLGDKREQVRKSISEQGKLTDELSSQLDRASTLTEIDDLYRPFRPKRRTRATIAKEKGLQALAELILEQPANTPVEAAALRYVDTEKGVETARAAIQGAMDIIAEIISDDPGYRHYIRTETSKKGLLTVKASDPKKESVYEMYYDFSEPVKSIVGHRILAINRGEKEQFLTVKIEPPLTDILAMLQRQILKKGNPNPEAAAILEQTIADAYKRLIEPSIDREIRNGLTERAEAGAINVFSKNLKQLLLQPPIKDKNVLAVDPGFRTGCKIAVVDYTGKVLDTTVVYPTASQNRINDAKAKLGELIEKHNVDLISIGNGTASRESELFVSELISEISPRINRKIYYIIVNEAGASIYSASKLGAEELPQFDVSIRGAVSIARRIQDPLAELVKIDPKSIGVGQYQYDMNQKHLGEALSGVVESCVNSVGVDLNTASPALLAYVSGISSAVAKNIIEHRDQNGKFKSRKELLKVKKLGPKAFEQCAGFLRISDGIEPLDNTGVHPESYEAVKRLLKIKEVTSDINELAEKLEIGLPTLNDILKELEKPGRDPREELPPPILRSDVLELDDLQEGMVLSGTVRNVIDFGVFVDIGVHQDGLVHISQITDKFIRHPLEILSVGDIVKVKIIGIDINKKRISLSMRSVK